jgi:YD repeat-containing protein
MAAGELVQVTDPDGRVRDFTFDTLGGPATSKETRAGGSFVTLTNHYGWFGSLTSMDVPPTEEPRSSPSSSPPLTTPISAPRPALLPRVSSEATG